MTVAAVISNRPDAKGLETAAAHGVSTRVVDHRQFSSREAFDEVLAGVIDSFSPDLVVLAGFMRILSDGFVTHYEGRLINIHPSLLPSFPGLHTHRLHLRGRASVDDEASLAARVLVQEHTIYPLAVRWFAEGRLRLIDGRVEFDAPQASEGALISPLARISP